MKESVSLMTSKVLLVDAEPASLRLLASFFQHDCQVLAAASGEEALRLLEQHDVALLVTDQSLPGMTGVELLKRTAGIRPHMVRIILTGRADAGVLVEAINCGQVYRCVLKPWTGEDLRLTFERALQHYVDSKARYEMGETNKRLSRRLREVTQGFVRAIADTLEAKDRHVYGHARRVSGYAVAVGRRLRLGVGLLEELSLAALMHDVGKIGTPDSILLKPSKLTDEEHAVVSLHSERGARLLAELPEMEGVASAVRHHHEDFDGAGYPDGLAGEQIPIASRIIRVTDAYDAMTSPRPFRDALDHEAAVRELSKRAGTQFDPEVVRAFRGLESLSKVRGQIAAGAFGSQFLSIMPRANLLKLPPAELLEVVECEPTLAALVLRAANEGCRTGSETASLPAACERLGHGALREIIAGADVSERISYEAEVLRDHSVRCATAARLLAERAGTLNPDAAYALALLHDVGEALLHTLFPEEAEKIAWLGPSGQAEREVAAFGVDHAQVGQWILDACGLPPAFSFIVQTHHDGNLVNDPAALLLHAADALACARDSSEVAGLEAFTPARLALLRLTRSDLARVHELVTSTIGERFDCVAQ